MSSRPDQLEEEFKGCLELAEVLPGHCRTCSRTAPSASRSGIRQTRRTSTRARRSSGKRRSASWRKILDDLDVKYTDRHRRGRVLRPEAGYSVQERLRQGRYAGHDPDRHAARKRSSAWSTSTRTARRRLPVHHPPHFARAATSAPSPT